MMTQKQILEIASNKEAMEILKEIAHIQSNLEYKTVYEQKSAKAEMKELAKALQELF